MAQAAFNHSVRVPRLYKLAAKVLTEVNNGGNIKTLISDLNHPVSSKMCLLFTFDGI